MYDSKGVARVHSDADPAQITLSAKISSQLARAAYDACKKELRLIDLRKSPNDIAALERMHAALDLLHEMRPQLEQHRKTLGGAKALLRGKSTDATGPLIENTKYALATLNALKAAAPYMDWDLPDLSSTMEALSDASKVIDSELSALSQRTKQIDDLCRQAALFAMANIKTPTAENINAIFGVYDLLDNDVLEGHTSVDALHMSAVVLVREQRAAFAKAKDENAISERSRIAGQLEGVWP